MSSVTVLCPNGHRQTVKVQANTKIIGIIEEVCSKRGFVPQEYDIIHQRRRMDVTLTFRLSGIPNNAQLELKKIEGGPRQFDNVIICIQLEDGSRLSQQSFKPDSTNLLEISKFYDSLPGEFKFNLDSETESVEDQPVFSYLNEQIIGVFQFKNTTLKDLGLTNGRGIVRFNRRKIDAESFSKINSEFRAKLDKKLKLEEIAKKNLESQTEAKTEIQSKPAEPQPIVQERPKPIDPIYNEPKQEPKRPRIEPQPGPKVIEYKPVPNEFANFKFPEETKGKQLNNFNELAEIEKESKKPCDRKALIFNMDSVESDKQGNSSAEPDESFYDVTINDLRTMLHDLKTIQNEDQPLMTKQMRELEMDKKAMRYTNVVVRIAFKNRLVLQGLFRPKEPIGELYKFVKDCIIQQDDFYLFSTPPKVILSEMKKNLFESHLCPASLIYYKNKSNDEMVPEFKKELMDSIKSIREANEIVDEFVHKTIRDIDHEGMNWLQKEQSVVQNILKTSNIAGTSKSHATSNHSHPDTSSREKDIDDLVNKKLEKFLKGSKK